MWESIWAPPNAPPVSAFEWVPALCSSCTRAPTEAGDLKLPIMDFFFHWWGQQPERNVPKPGIPGQFGSAGPCRAPGLQIHLNAHSPGSWGGDPAKATFFQLGLLASSLGSSLPALPARLPESFLAPGQQPPVPLSQRPTKPPRNQHIRTPKCGQLWPQAEDTPAQAFSGGLNKDYGLPAPPNPQGLSLPQHPDQGEKLGLAWAQAALSLGRGRQGGRGLPWSLAW